MNNTDNFVTYEYKSITVKQESATLYSDCLRNFGWTLINEREHGFQPELMGVSLGYANINTTACSVETPPDKVDGLEMITMKFKRNRQLHNKGEIDRLERECEEALTAINKLEKKKSALTMGASLGIGIVGTAFLGLAGYGFSSANIVLGVLSSVIGVVGWGIGFLASRKVGKKQSLQAEPMIQQQFDVVYKTCEQAHAMLA